MTRAADRPSPESIAGSFVALAQSHLWTIVVGQAPSLERLMAQALLSGHAVLNLRAGRTDDGESFFPAATTRQRLARSGLGQPGDTVVLLPFWFLAKVARGGGTDSLVINPGTVPFGHIDRMALATFADGGIPDPAAPDRKLTITSDQQGPIEPLDIDALPAGLLDAAIRAARDEPQIAGASLAVRSLGEGRVFTILAVVAEDADRRALTERLASQVVNLIGGENYLAVEFVARDDPRLSDPRRAAVLTTA